MSADITADQVYAEKLAKTSPLAAAALHLADTVETTDAKRPTKRELAAHYFDSTSEVRKVTESDEAMADRDIQDGDIIIVDTEQVIALMIGVIPAAITENTGRLTALGTSSHTYAGGAWADSAELAERTAHEREYRIHPRHVAKAPADPAPVELPSFTRNGRGGSYLFTRHGRRYEVRRYAGAGPWTVTWHDAPGDRTEVLGQHDKTRKAAVLQALTLLDKREVTKPKPEPVGGIQPGERVKCSDGWTRTAKSVSTDQYGKTWIHMDNGSAWTVDKCEPIDTSRIAEFTASLYLAGAYLRSENEPGGKEAREALSAIGDALRYLHRADPDGLTAIRDASTQRSTGTVSRIAIVPTDVIHQHGVRLRVLETGICDDQSTGRTKWWAEVEGADEEDRHATWHCPWTMSLPIEDAMRDKVIIERMISAAPTT